MSGDRLPGPDRTPEGGDPLADALLDVRNVSVVFGGLVAVDDVSFRLGRGEVLGLIGPNGAGKTTLFNAISGAVTRTQGEVWLEGQRIDGRPMHSISTLGVVRTFQLARSFARLTVAENLAIACIGRPPRCSTAVFTPWIERRERRIRAQRVGELLEEAELGAWRDAVTGDLPHGVKRLLGLAMCLARDPRVLLLDEPLNGLTGPEAVRILDLCRGTAARGVGVLMVEHNVRAVIESCQRVVVLNMGRKIAEDRSDKISDHSEVVEAYLGSAREAGSPVDGEEEGKTA